MHNHSHTHTSTRTNLYARIHASIHPPRFLIFGEGVGAEDNSDVSSYFTSGFLRQIHRFSNGILGSTAISGRNSAGSDNAGNWVAAAYIDAYNTYIDPYLHAIYSNTDIASMHLAMMVAAFLLTMGGVLPVPPALRPWLAYACVLKVFTWILYA